MSNSPVTRDSIAEAYWTLLAACLAVWLIGGVQIALICALGLGGIQLVHFGLRHGSPAAFPVQVRAAYLLLLLLGTLDALRWIHWIQLAGTSAVITVDYCPLARMMSLMPWNRRRPLSGALILSTLFTPPGVWQHEP